jgi:rhodanese-related sulfurtransferase
MSENTTSADMVAAAKEDLEELEPQRFAEEAERDEAVVVDLRDADELAAGVIPGAVHVPRGMLEFRADPASSYHDDRLRPDARVLLHCASGGRSALAAQTLRSLGYQDVAHLEGGFNAWRDAGMPVELPS